MSYTIRGILPILGISVFSSNLGNGLIAPLLPLYAENLGASGLWLGIIFSGVSISSAVFMPFAGRLSDHVGRKLILSIGLFVFTMTSFAYIWANTIAGLMAVRFVQGAAASMVLPISQAYIGDIAPKGQEGKWLGIFNATFIAGFGFGPLMGGVLSDYFGMNYAFYSMGFLNLIAFLGVTFILPEVSRRKSTTAKHSVRAITASGITRGIFSYQTGVAAQRGIMMAFLPILSSIYIGLTSSLIGTILTVAVVVNSLMQIPSGQLADKYNRRLLIVLGCLGSAISMVLIPQARTFSLLLTFMIFGSVCDSLAMPPAMAMIVQVGRKYGMGAATSISNMGMGFGMGLAPVFAGFVVDLSDVRVAFYIASAATFMGISFFSLFTRTKLSYGF